MHMETRGYELTESEWNRIKDKLPPEQPKAGKRGRPAKYDKAVGVSKGGRNTKIHTLVDGFFRRVSRIICVSIIRQKSSIE